MQRAAIVFNAAGLTLMSVVVGCGSSSHASVAANATASTTTIVTAVSGSASASSASAIEPSSTEPTTASTTEPKTSTSPLPQSGVDGTGVRGRVTAGPTCPVERPDQPCPPRPVQATVAAITTDGATAASTRTDSDGRYAVPLGPGHYTLHVSGNGPFPRCPDTTVTVTNGPALTADITCDTGIR